MTDAERREAARRFAQKWKDKGREDEDDRSFWIEFLQDVIGLDHVTDRIEFQKKVLNSKGTLSNRIDAYIPETKVLIEQKTLDIDLSKPQQGHGGKTPYEQAKEYDNALPVSEKSKWIIVSNFAEIWIYDMDLRVPEPVKVMLSEIPNKYSLFEFLADKKQQKISQEMEVSVKAGEFVGLIYDALYKQYIDPTSEKASKSLNMLCVRLVFCLYADDAYIFGDSGHMFHDYMAQFDANGMRRALIDLFRILDTPEDKRDPYDDSDLSKFPYVNGGLFADEDIEIPKFTDEIRDILLAKASEGFNWSQISPTIFGAVFESTLNPETRRSGGMHYTSIENIHKVIDPLFLDELKAELAEIKEIKALKTRNPKLRAFRRKLAKLKWLDPACGSGNFLTETYLSIRRLENEVIETLNQGQIGMYFADDEESEDPILVSISQFYGIEINDFAVTVAKTALWIAESQMIKETERIIKTTIDFLPLKTNAFIHEGNALRIDWEEVCPMSELNYIMGNPPFLGYSNQSPKQKNDILSVFVDEYGNPYKSAGKIDYVSGWYFKAASFIKNTGIKVAFVSTNSITQGEQVAFIWKPLYERFGIHIDFAYRTFIWDSEASLM
ncbi:MAG: SAM-dependent DNA methyltransferase [Oribacterium sp.]|nr:SAM-dependent DNA methyltransferase [Oribacterium sp.]